MVRSYYNDFETDRSLDVLNKLSTEENFVLIGDWAVNKYMKLQKSKDVDIVVTLDTLQNMKKKYGIKEHAIKAFFSLIDGVTVDIFVEGISDAELTIPVKEILEHSHLIEGIKVVDKNMLALLKLCGYFSGDKTKIEKDIIDLVMLIFYGELDFGAISAYAQKFSIDPRKSDLGMLEYLDKGANLWEYITDTEKEYVKLREEYKIKIKRAFHRK